MEATAANIFMVLETPRFQTASGGHFHSFGRFAAAARSGLGDEEAVFVTEDSREVAFEFNEHLHVLREADLLGRGHLG
jgi:hypothetical protein